MIKRFFSKDTIAVGLAAGLGSIILTALLLFVGLKIANEPVLAHLRWFAGCFVPPLLLLRYFVKQKQGIVTKTLFVILFFTFIAFIIYLFSTHNLRFE